MKLGRVGSQMPEVRRNKELEVGSSLGMKRGRDEGRRRRKRLTSEVQSQRCYPEGVNDG
ncbi:MAG: hypothetical protein WD426_12770 [Anditalea sp.]